MLTDLHDYVYHVTIAMRMRDPVSFVNLFFSCLFGCSENKDNSVTAVAYTN